MLKQKYVHLSANHKTHYTAPVSHILCAQLNVEHKMYTHRKSNAGGGSALKWKTNYMNILIDFTMCVRCVRLVAA